MDDVHITWPFLYVDSAKKRPFIVCGMCDWAFYLKHRDTVSHNVFCTLAYKSVVYYTNVGIFTLHSISLDVCVCVPLVLKMKT